MTIGGSIFLIAVGAILAFAINEGNVGPVQIYTVGVILMIAGIVALVLSLFFASRATRRGGGDREVVRDREVR